MVFTCLPRGHICGCAYFMAYDDPIGPRSQYRKTRRQEAEIVMKIRQFSIWLLFILAISMSWIHVSKIRSVLMSQKYDDEFHLIQANKIYPYIEFNIHKLIKLYEKAYRKEPNPKNFEKWISNDPSNQKVSFIP